MKNNNSHDFQNKYTAFLRGINVGGQTILKMKELRKLFESIGFLNVQTLLASGNVLFETKEKSTLTLSKNIEIVLQKKFERQIMVIVRSLIDIEKLVDSQPFKNIDIKPNDRLLVTFLPENITYSKISDSVNPKDFIIINAFEGIICSVLHYQSETGTPHLMKFLEKEFGQNITTRTWNTIIRLLLVANK